MHPTTSPFLKCQFLHHISFYSPSNSHVEPIMIKTPNHLTASVSIYRILFKTSKKMIKIIPLIFPMHCIKNSFYNLLCPVCGWDQKWPGAEQSIGTQNLETRRSVFSVFWLQITKQRTTERISDQCSFLWWAITHNTDPSLTWLTWDFHSCYSLLKD